MASSAPTLRADIVVNYDAVSPYIADSSSTALADGKGVRIGMFSGISTSTVAANAYNLTWLNTNFTSFDATTTTTFLGQAGRFSDSPAVSNASFSNETLYLFVSDDDGETFDVGSVTEFGIFRISSGEGSVFPDNSASPPSDEIAWDSSNVDTVHFGSINGATSLNLNAKLTELHWDNSGGAGLGGTGTWSDVAGAALFNNSSDNFADGSGNGLFDWDSEYAAVFQGTAGTVSIQAAGVTANEGMTFNVDGYTLQNNTITLNGSTADKNTITVTTSGHTATINSVIDDGANMNGITKAGAGTLILGGSNTFDGDVIINSGTLMLGANNPLPSGANITLKDILNTDDTTFDTGGFDQNLGTLTLDGTSNIYTIDLGDGDSVLTFTDVSGLADNTLNVYNWNGNPWGGGGPDQLIFSSDVLSTVELNNIHFFYGSGTGSFDAISNNKQETAGEVHPAVPEASTWLITTCLGLLCVGRSRHRLIAYFRYRNVRPEA